MNNVSRYIAIYISLSQETLWQLSWWSWHTFIIKQLKLLLFATRHVLILSRSLYMESINFET